VLYGSHTGTNVSKACLRLSTVASSISIPPALEKLLVDGRSEALEEL